MCMCNILNNWITLCVIDSLSLSCFSLCGDRVYEGNDATLSAFRLDWSKIPCTNILNWKYSGGALSFFCVLSLKLLWIPVSRVILCTHYTCTWKLKSLLWPCLRQFLENQGLDIQRASWRPQPKMALAIEDWGRQNPSKRWPPSPSPSPSPVQVQVKDDLQVQVKSKSKSKMTSLPPRRWLRGCPVRDTGKRWPHSSYTTSMLHCSSPPVEETMCRFEQSLWTECREWLNRE